MKTEALIRTLAADAAPGRPVGPVLAVTLAVSAAAVGVVVLSILGINPELGAMLASWPLLLLRQVFPTLLALGSALLALRLARPGAAPGAALSLFPLAALVAGFVVGRELTLVPRADWGRAAMGGTAGACLLTVGLTGSALLAGTLRALARGASTRPRLSGALAGLLAGSVAAVLYALHCTETSPLFYAVWYGLAILGVTGLGALVGPRLLRW